MALDTLRTNKMRSALTVLGVVIGITSIVGMTSLIRGFDQSLRDSISQLGPNTIIVAEVRRAQLRVGQELPRGGAAAEPDHRGRARRSSATARRWRWSTCGSARRAATAAVAHLLRQRDARGSSAIIGATENWSATSTSRRSKPAASSPPRKSSTARRSSCSATARGRRSSRNIDPIGKKVRIGAIEYTVIGVLGKRPSPGGFGGADDFALIPYSTHEKQFGKVLKGSAKISAGSFNPAVFRTAMIAVVPREGVARAGDARGRERSCASATA